MYPSEWAINKTDYLARYHPVVWVEDPYGLIESKEINWLRNSLSILGHAVIAVTNAFDLRRELLGRDPATSRLVIIDQSYTLRDPHLLPRDARPGDLASLPAPDWKPFVEEDAVFRPTVRDFLQNATDDDRWPVEVNIYPYEELARSDPDAFVRAHDSFRQTGRTLTSMDLLMVGASAVFGVDLVDTNDPVVALGVAFHSQDKWANLSRFFNASELAAIRRYLQSLPQPVGDLFGDRADTARLAVTALLVLRQHFEEPGIHLPVLSPALAAYTNITPAGISNPPSWFLQDEMPNFEALVNASFTKYVSTTLKLSDPENARAFAARERLSPKLQALALPFIDVRREVPARPEDDFALTRLVPEFRELKQKLQQIVADAKPKIDRFRLTPLKEQTAGKALEVFRDASLFLVDTLASRLEGLMRDIEGPARRQWAAIAGFQQRWETDTRECRDLINNAAHIRDDLDYLFGKLLESRYADIVPKEVSTTRVFYEGFIAPRRRAAGGKTLKAVVLVIDSMRFDLWRQLVRPTLEPDFQIDEIIAFAELPSETRISRSSFFAGMAPGQLPQNFRETDLFANLLSRIHGQAQAFERIADKRQGLRYAVRSKDQLTLAGVFDFADTLSHRIDWNAYTVQEALRPLVREIRAMLASESPDALVFITSDHGHFLQEGGAPIYLEGAADVGYRSAYITSRVGGQDGQHLFQIPAVTLGHSLPGLFVFPRPRFYLRNRDADQGSGQPYAGYRHGGISLFEVAIPLVCLHHRSAPTQVDISLNSRGKLLVGEEAAIEASLTSNGLIHSPVRLSADTEDVEAILVSDISTTPAVHRMRFRPGSPGRRRILIKAHLGEQEVGSAPIELDVAAAPIPEDEAKRKLRKLFGED